jgi:hypothetical protein
MVSGYIAEASAQNSKPKRFQEMVLIALHGYIDVFSKMAFDALPHHQKWDHAIDLEHEPSPGFRKVYLMTLTEQKKMDIFLEEASYWSHQTVKITTRSTSLLHQEEGWQASLFAGLLCPQHQMQKNYYPFPLIDNLIHHLQGVHYFTKLDVHGDIIISISKRAMSGRLHSTPTEAYLSPW